MMIDAVHVPKQKVNTGDSVLFESTRICTGCSARHESGSGRFVLLKPGIYEVSFNANVAAPTGSKTEIIILDLVQDGEPVAGSRMISTPEVKDAYNSVSMSKLIRVYEYCCCASLTVRNDSIDTISVQDANLTITRHC